jgi:hypothetical protein
VRALALPQLVDLEHLRLAVHLAADLLQHWEELGDEGAPLLLSKRSYARR